ncbi:Oidioi.mRNA.OKI2018_I69.PAR.g11956.t1.cds [Oikopleura dioica]|uniref:Oidioi.mRNA.OKI2018_I69.PAR.g11956.t1.cds n=1 Tax=Oikopleura dioica TaxID=34765 RepID=A0ABN7S2W5_OIKDI|nr:Oidioi.mRNA.OKI2018_I69.PAR.g11956.t1.cds [Oikopleura dioica]
MSQETPIICLWENNGYPCHRIFATTEGLDSHLAFHINENATNPAHCYWSGCSRKTPFKAKYQLTIHVKIHSGHKPFKCDYCEMSFARAENLKIHRRKHTGERPYACPEPGCSSTFASATDRRKHRFVHSSTPMSCDHCHKTFYHPQSLRLHMKKVHSDETTENPSKRKREETPEEHALNSTISSSSDYYSSMAPTPPPSAKRFCQMPSMFAPAIPIQMWYSTMGYAEHFPTNFSEQQAPPAYPPTYYLSYPSVPQPSYPAMFQPYFQ